MDSIQDAPTNFRTPDRWNSVVVPARVAARAIENVDKQDDGCWISRYSVASHGYSQIGWQDAGDRHVVLGHRAAWVAVNGQVPLGMTIDHTCKVRRCVNPDHLRLLPNFENARRIEGMDWPMGYCANGHTAESLVPVKHRSDKAGNSRPGMGCHECYRIYALRGNWRQRHPGAALPESLWLESERKA